MNDTERSLRQAQDDLEFVRSAVQRGGEGNKAPTIYFLWAAISLAGLSIVDFRPHAAGPFWAVAGPLGSILSGVLGARHGRRTGQTSARAGVSHMIHWFGFMATILLMVPLVARGDLKPEAMSKVILLVVGLSYLTGGNYLDHRLRWLSLVVYGGYVLTLVMPAYGWTAAGVALSLSLVAAGLLELRRGRAQA